MSADQLHLVNYWDGLESEPFDPKTAPEAIASVVHKCFSYIFRTPKDLDYLPLIRLAVHKMNVYLNKNGVKFLPADMKKRDRNAPDLAEMALAAGISAGFPESERKFDVVLHASLIALLMIRRDDITRSLKLYKSNSDFLEVYLSVDTCFGCLSSNDPETILLKRYANYMIVAKEVIIAKQNKERLMNICSCLNEGIVYVTGSGEKLETSRRVKIYENETGLLRVPRLQTAVRSTVSITSPMSIAALSNRFLTSNSCRGLDFPCSQFIEAIKEVLSLSVKGIVNIKVIPQKLSLRKVDASGILHSEKKQYVEIVLLTTGDGCFLEAGSIKEVVATPGYKATEYIVQNVISCNKKMTTLLPHLAEIDVFNEFGSPTWLPSRDMSSVTQGIDPQTQGLSPSPGSSYHSSGNVNYNNDPVNAWTSYPQQLTIGSRCCTVGSITKLSDSSQPLFTPGFNWDHGFGFSASSNSVSLTTSASSHTNKVAISASKRYRTTSKSSIAMVKCVSNTNNGLFFETTSGKTTVQPNDTDICMPKKRKVEDAQMMSNYLPARAAQMSVQQSPFDSFNPSPSYVGPVGPASFASESFFQSSTNRLGNTAPPFASLALPLPVHLAPMTSMSIYSLLPESSSQLYVISNKFDRPVITPVPLPYSRSHPNVGGVTPLWASTEATDFIQADSDVINGLLSLSGTSKIEPSKKSMDTSSEVYHNKHYIPTTFSLSHAATNA